MSGKQIQFKRFVSEPKVFPNLDVHPTLPDITPKGVTCDLYKLNPMGFLFAPYELSLVTGPLKDTVKWSQRKALLKCDDRSI